jgi:Ca2+-binding RTX toxin-like protein
MTTYTYNGTAREDWIDVGDLFAVNPSFTSFSVNGNGGDDSLYADEEVTSVLNGGDGDDWLTTYGVANATLNGNAGDDDLYIPFLSDNSKIRVTGGRGNDQLIIGNYDEDDIYDEINGLALGQASDPVFSRTPNGTNISLYDKDMGGSADVFVEDSVEFIVFYDELGAESVYTTEDLASGITKKYIGDKSAESEIDWWYEDSIPSATTSSDSNSDATPEAEPNLLFSKKKGKDKLIGTAGEEDYFYIEGDGKDKLINFDPKQDLIALNRKNLMGGIENARLHVASNKKDLKKLQGLSAAQLIYFEPKGRLFLDANGSDKGLKDGSDGGLIAKLQGAPELTPGKHKEIIVINW